MILIGLGSNLPSAAFGAPTEILEAAIAVIENKGIKVAARSRFYETAPVPKSDHPWYINCVIRVETDLGPEPLLDVLLDIERQFGRRRSVTNAPRVLDLDLLAHGASVTGPDSRLVLPHPRMRERAFVLLPLLEIAPDWRYPTDETPISTLIAQLPGGQDIRVCS